MVERFAARPRRLDEHPQVGTQLRLPDELVERLGTERRIDILGAA